MFLAQGHNTAEVGFEPPTSRSGVRRSTTKPPRPYQLGEIYSQVKESNNNVTKQITKKEAENARKKNEHNDNSAPPAYEANHTFHT